MNLVIIGDKSAVTVERIVKETYDDVEVQIFKDTNVFLREVLLRNMEIHRIMLMQDGIDRVEDDRVYSFVDYIFEHYPAVRIITVSNEEDVQSFLGNLINSPQSLHIMFQGKIIARNILDLVSKDIIVLKKTYSKYVYKKDNTGVVDIIDEDSETQDKNNSTPTNQKKRGFLSKVFGVGYKGDPQVQNQGGTKGKVGQGVGAVDEFSNLEEEVTDISFDVFDTNEGDLGLGYNGREVFETLDKEENISKQNIDEWEDSLSEEDDEKTTEETFSTEEDNEVWVEDEGSWGLEDMDEWTSNEDDWSSDSTDDWSTDSTDEWSTDTFEGEEETEEKSPSGKFEEIKKEIESTPIIVNPKTNTRRKPKVELEEVEEEVLDNLDLENLMKDYEQSNVQVVEKVKIVEKVITTGGKRQYRNKNGVRIVIVTGDRRVGVTKLSMNLANVFSQEDKTLLVDLDRYRKGVITYLGVEDIIEEPEHIQNGLTHLRNIKMLNNVTYFYPMGGFNCLFSMYGEEVTDSQVDSVQKILYNQTEYDTIVIDCPIENLYLLSDLLYISTVLVCIEDDKVGITNAILSLNAAVEDRFMPALYNNSQIVVARGSNIEKFKEQMSEVVNIFGLDETTTNWGLLDIVGTIRGTKGIAKGIGG